MRIHLLAASLLLAVPALADSPSGTVPSTQSAAPATDEAHLSETVCKKQPPPTGSRIAGKTVCMTNREWLALWDESKRATDAMQNKPISKGPSGN